MVYLLLNLYKRVSSGVAALQYEKKPFAFDRWRKSMNMPLAIFQVKSATEAIDVCSEAHQRDPRNAKILRDRAEAFILNQDYEKGRPPPLLSRELATPTRRR